jgi:hypothetical protein
VQNNRQNQELRSLGIALFFAATGFVLTTVLTGCVDSQSVTVRKEKMYPQKHTLDDASLTKAGAGAEAKAEAEAVAKAENAHRCARNPHTCWEFRINPTIAVTKTKAIKEAHWHSTTVKVKHVTVELSLPFDMWLPKNASDDLVAHEDGHVFICRRFYREAAHQARKCALHLIGREFIGEAKDEATAEKIAINAVANELSSCYSEKIVQRADRASDTFDKLTAHGPDQLPVPDAIEKAIEEAQQ